MPPPLAVPLVLSPQVRSGRRVERSSFLGVNVSFISTTETDFNPADSPGLTSSP